MSYHEMNGTFVPSASLIAAPPSARTASGSGGSIEVGARTTLRLALVTTAVSGTSPTLNARVETSHDGATWRTHSTVEEVTATGTVRKSFGGLDRFVRIAWTLGGTSPSFTFSASGEMV